MRIMRLIYSLFKLLACICIYLSSIVPNIHRLTLRFIYYVRDIPTRLYLELKTCKRDARVMFFPNRTRPFMDIGVYLGHGIINRKLINSRGTLLAAVYRKVDIRI